MPSPMNRMMFFGFEMSTTAALSPAALSGPACPMATAAAAALTARPTVAIDPTRNTRIRSS